MISQQFRLLAHEPKSRRFGAKLSGEKRHEDAFSSEERLPTETSPPTPTDEGLRRKQSVEGRGDANLADLELFEQEKDALDEYIVQ